MLKTEESMGFFPLVKNKSFHNWPFLRTLFTHNYSISKSIFPLFPNSVSRLDRGDFSPHFVFSLVRWKPGDWRESLSLERLPTETWSSSIYPASPIYVLKSLYHTFFTVPFNLNFQLISVSPLHVFLIIHIGDRSIDKFTGLTPWGEEDGCILFYLTSFYSLFLRCRLTGRRLMKYTVIKHVTCREKVPTDRSFRSSLFNDSSLVILTNDLSQSSRVTPRAREGSPLPLLRTWRGGFFREVS